MQLEHVTNPTKSSKTEITKKKRITYLQELDPQETNQDFPRCKVESTTIELGRRPLSSGKYLEKLIKTALISGPHLLYIISTAASRRKPFLTKRGTPILFEIQTPVVG